MTSTLDIKSRFVSGNSKFHKNTANCLNILLRVVAIHEN